jgi:aspartate carbamoyltransferase catalytic subunit
MSIATARTKTMTRKFSQDHLTGIDHLADSDIESLMFAAHDYAAAIEKDKRFASTKLAGKRILNLFYEDSTRTRASFDVAAQRLGAQTFNIDIATSSVNKGESLIDTVKTMEAITLPDAIVVRHKEYGAPGYIAQHVDAAVINAGDSWREHPTQALLDVLTMQRCVGDIAKLTVAICGDVAHSRVAGSDMILLRRLGATVRVIAPAALMPQKFPADGIETADTLESGLPGCNVVMMLRLQKERMQAGLIDSDEEYFRQYGLTAERLALAKPGAFVMHPGPMNRGVEIAPDVADDPQRSLILKQVFYGVPARMAVFDRLLAR